MLKYFVLVIHLHDEATLVSRLVLVETNCRALVDGEATSTSSCHLWKNHHHHHHSVH